MIQDLLPFFLQKFANAISLTHYDYVIIPSLENYVVVSFKILVLLTSGVFAITIITTYELGVKFCIHVIHVQ